jgi:hypothetical protein
MKKTISLTTAESQLLTSALATLSRRLGHKVNNDVRNNRQTLNRVFARLERIQQAEELARKINGVALKTPVEMAMLYS